MPCYKYKFPEFQCPLYYYGHVLPPPIVKIVLQYAYEMTIWEDMCTLHDKLEGTLAWLHDFKDILKDHVEAYQILSSRNTVSDTIRLNSSKLCHEATVSLATTLNPPRRRPRGFFTVHVPAPAPLQNLGFVLPEMVNYL